LQERLLNKTTEFDDQIRAHRLELDDSRRAYRDELDQLRRENTDGADRLSRAHRDEVRELERRAIVDVEDRLRELERKHDAKLDEERSRRLREVQKMSKETWHESRP
jgi:kinesin family protein C1